MKLRYYEYMIELDQHEGTYLNICRHYRAVYETPSIRDNPSEKLRILKHVVLFVVLRLESFTNYKHTKYECANTL